MAFNEKLQKSLKETMRVKPFNCDSVFTKNSEFKKHNTLLQVKFKALSMEEKDEDMWWDAIYNIYSEKYWKDLKKV
jgi:hypothetical protein